MDINAIAAVGLGIAFGWLLGYYLTKEPKETNDAIDIEDTKEN